MIITNKALPRRTFLRGAGVALALPSLDAMIPVFSKASGAASPVRRLGFVYIPMGCNWFQWFPKQVGNLTELSPTLSTLDQIAAKQIGKETRLPSLELAVDLTTPIGACDGGMSCVYENSLSWSSPTTPLPSEANPRVLFERLFGDGGTAADQLAALREDGSMIDFVSDDIAHVQKKLGAGDRTKLSQYLESVREVERRIQKAEEQ